LKTSKVAKSEEKPSPKVEGFDLNQRSEQVNTLPPSLPIKRGLSTTNASQSGMGQSHPQNPTDSMDSLHNSNVYAGLIKFWRMCEATYLAAKSPRKIK